MHRIDQNDIKAPAHNLLGLLNGNSAAQASLKPGCGSLRNDADGSPPAPAKLADTVPGPIASTQRRRRSAATASKSNTSIVRNSF
jgi:hypothetical protein